MGMPSLIDGSSKGAIDTGYEFPNARIAHQSSDSLVPIGIWRSVAHSHNAFFTESFIDEAAFAAGQDPVKLSARRCWPAIRAFCACFNARPNSRTGAGRWRPLPTARSRRAALRCIAASAASSPMSRKCPLTRRKRSACIAFLVCSIVDSRSIRTWSASRSRAASSSDCRLRLRGEITLEKGQVQQSNFHDYAPLRMNECPDRSRSDILPSNEHPGGIGETGTPSIAPAVANALFALTGRRLRSLPLKLVG